MFVDWYTDIVIPSSRGDLISELLQQLHFFNPLIRIINLHQYFLWELVTNPEHRFEYGGSCASSSTKYNYMNDFSEFSWVHTFVIGVIMASPFQHENLRTNYSDFVGPPLHCNIVVKRMITDLSFTVSNLQINIQIGI